MEDGAKNYWTKLHCQNCEYDNEVEIPKGITEDQYSEKLICTFCGCRVIQLGQK